MSAIQGVIHLEPLQATAPADEDKGFHMDALVQETLKKMRTATANMGMTAIVMIVSLVLCMCIVSFSIAYPDKVPGLGDRSYAQSDDVVKEQQRNDKLIVQASQQRGLSPRMMPSASQQRGLSPRMMPSTGPSPAPSGPLDYLQQARSSFATSGTLYSQARMLPGSQARMTQASSYPPSTVAEDSQDVIFPPLCPSLVMPQCKSRFGLAMFELAQVAGEGEVNILGGSGNPLLRGVIHKIGESRSLEVSMLLGSSWGDSRPKATVTPSLNAPVGTQQGVKVLEIKGMRGAFYGTLEMRSSGTTRVIRDGQTVLKVDGDAESLKLSLTSGSGKPLASVRCSDEDFAGDDHVEIVVDAGVDTVLCLAVVLSVLLLSPYVKDV